MQFKPRTQTQIEKEKEEAKIPLNIGPAAFKIVSAVDGKSKAGNDMMTVKLQVKDCKGRVGKYPIRDFFTDTAESVERLQLLLKSIGKESLYDTGVVDNYNLQGSTGLCTLVKQEDSEYIRIGDYMPGNGENHFDEPNDEIPF